MRVRAPGGSGNMPSGCAALPAKKTTDAEGLVCVWRNRTMPSSVQGWRRLELLFGFTIAYDKSVELVAYDVAHVLARGQVARHRFLDATLPGVGHAHLDRAAAVAKSAKSSWTRCTQRRSSNRAFAQLLATAKYWTTRSFDLLTSHRDRRSRTWPRARRASRRRALPAPRGRPP